MIAIENLTKSYRIQGGRHYVFKNLNLAFPEGANIGIIGPNGAGKSTFLRLLGGIDYPDRGRIRTDSSFSWPLGLRGGFVGHMTGRANCRMICNLYGLPREEIVRKLAVVKELSGIGRYFEEPVNYYSSGMSGRLGFALSMAFEFDYFLIDEITSVGDANFKKLAKEALEAKAQSSKVIMVSHSMADLKRFCDIGVLIKNGQLKVFEDLEKAIHHYLPPVTEGGAKEILANNSDLEGLGLDNAELSKVMSSLELEVRQYISSINQKLASSQYGFLVPAASFFTRFAALLMELGDVSKAETYARRALLEDPGYQQALIELCKIEGILNRPREKKQLLERIGQIDPEQPYLLMQSGNDFLRRGEPDKALNCVEKILERQPEAPFALHFKAKVFFQQGHLQAALDIVGQLLKVHRETPVFYQLLSQILATMGRYEMASRASWKASRESGFQEEKKYRSLVERLSILDGQIHLKS